MRSILVPFCKTWLLPLLAAAVLLVGLTGAALAQSSTTFRLIPPVSGGTLNDVSMSSTTDAWAVGTHNNSDNTIIFTQTQHWNGQNWTVVPSPSPHNNVDILSAVVDLSSTNAWAVGYGQSSSGETRALIEHFNGASWSVVPAANDSNSVEDTLSAITAVSANDVWAVGSHFDSTIGGDDSFFEHWNGQNWSIVPSPSGVFHLDALAAISSTDIWAAVGALTTFSSTTFEHWNGQSWSIVSGPGVSNANNGIASIAAVSSQDVWAVGTSKAPGRRTPTLPLIEHWNGSTWSIFQSPATGTFAAFLSGVTALSSTDAWAVGGTFTGSPVVEHWDGIRWNLVSVPVSTGAFNNQLSAVSSLPGGTVIAVGPTLAILTNNG